MTDVFVRGLTGATGKTGKGLKGNTGDVGPIGLQGDSAFIRAVKAGFSGTEAQWLVSLKGDTGLKGDKGDKGDTGPVATSEVGFPCDLSFTRFGTLTANLTLGMFLCLRPIILALGDNQTTPSSNLAKSGVAATASSTFTIKVNGVAKGTFVFAAAATTATFSTSVPVTCVKGDVITITAPAVADTTLADVTVSLKGTYA